MHQVATPPALRWRFGFLPQRDLDQFLNPRLQLDPLTDTVRQQFAHIDRLLVQPFRQHLKGLQIEPDPNGSIAK